MAKAQSIIEEDVVVIPIYEQGVIYLLHPKVRGVRRTVVGGDQTSLTPGSSPKPAMGRYILERLVGGVITVWFIATATFFAMHAVPGDPLMNEKAATPEIRANLAKQYGLTVPA